MKNRRQSIHNLFEYIRNPEFRAEYDDEVEYRMSIGILIGRVIFLTIMGGLVFLYLRAYLQHRL